MLKVLLKYGVDPNEPSNNTLQSKSRRNSHHTSTDAVSPIIPSISVPCLPPPPPPSQQQQQLCGESRQPSPTLILPPQDNSPYDDRSEAGHPCSSRAQTAAVVSQVPSCSSANQSLKQNHSLQSTTSWLRGHRRSSDLTPCSSSAPTRSPVSGHKGLLGAPHLPEIVETAAESGFNFSAHYGKDELLNLPCLYLAVVDGNPYVVQLLLRYGAQPNVQDAHGCSPLHLACSQEYFNLENVRSLLKHGGRIHLKNLSNDTPFSLYPDVVGEQRSVVRAALARVTFVQPPGKPRSRASTVTSQNFRDCPLPPTPTHEQMVSCRSGSVSRFFKRLSSDPRPRSRRITRDESSNFTSDVVRERTYSSGSCKSLRSRHFSSCVQDDMESDISLVGTFYIIKCLV